MIARQRLIEHLRSPLAEYATGRSPGGPRLRAPCTSVNFEKSQGPPNCPDNVCPPPLRVCDWTLARRGATWGGTRAIRPLDNCLIYAIIARYNCLICAIIARQSMRLDARPAGRDSGAPTQSDRCVVWNADGYAQTPSNNLICPHPRRPSPKAYLQPYGGRSSL